MPWTVKNPPSVAKNWAQAQKEKCVSAANATLEDGGTEKEAIFACIAAAGKSKKKKGSQQMSRAADQKAQERRSRRYRIQIRDDGNLTKPDKWGHLNDSQFGDPTNYLYPVPDKSHASNAKSRFKQHSDMYDSRSQGVVRGRINRLCRKYDVEPIKSSDKKPGKKLGAPKGGIRFFAEIVQEEFEESDPHFGLLRIPAARATVLHHPWWGPIYLDEDLFESFIDNWETNVVGFDLALDKEHEPQDGALAWVRDMEINGDSFDLWVEPTALGDVLGDVWKYASIEYTEDYVDPETGVSYGPTLRGCAATNRPFVHRQDAIQILSVGSRDCDDWQCKLHLKEQEDSMPNITFDDTDIEAVSPAEGLGGEEDVGLNVPEDTSPEPTEEPVVQPVPQQPTEHTAPPPAAQPAMNTDRIEIGGVSLTLGDVAELVTQNAALLKRDHDNQVSAACETASARGVAPTVVEAARQILSAVDPNASTSIKLSVPGDKGDTVVKDVNLFGAVTELLALVPGVITEMPLTYHYQEDRPGTENALSDNPYAADDVAMTAEEAEEAARTRRKELGIRFTRTPGDSGVEM